MQDIPMCPICETEIDYTRFCFDDCDGDTAYFKSHGRCPECGREYRWYEKYYFGTITDLSCISEREE